MSVVEEQIRHYLDARQFRSKYPEPYRLWSEAADLLWGADSDRELTTIGHKTREAIQAFATDLVSRYQPPSVNQDPTKTVDRLRAVIATQRERLGEKRTAFLDALIHYWGTLSDLVQRQEHGAQKGGEPLTWEDGRRAVFQTAIVMFEVDSAL